MIRDNLFIVSIVLMGAAGLLAERYPGFALFAVSVGLVVSIGMFVASIFGR